ncbi:hypothetical protein BY996DRAFT_6889931 [Phakopsora pachyrhizi]|nr:hypothetical protein BY996DRAFT_6889931 [Phakopsora pachyrhizi]
MLVLFLVLLFCFISSSWSYVPEGLLRVADGELQVKRFAHPPDDQDFSWLIGEHHHQFGIHTSDSHSNLSIASSFQQPLTCSSESSEQLLNDYPQELIAQAHHLTGEPRFDNGNHRGDDPHSYNSAINFSQHGGWAEWVHHPSNSIHIVQPELNQLYPHGHFVPNYQHPNGQPGSIWAQPPSQDQSIEGSNLPSRYLSSPGRNKNLVNEEVANNQFIKTSDILNIFENDIALSTFSPPINAMYDTSSSYLEPDFIQGFENRNLGELVDHENPTQGLPGASYFHEDHLSHTNYSPEEISDNNISIHTSPESDINFDQFLNDLICSPPHQVEENENGKLGFSKNLAMTPQVVAAQCVHKKNSEFAIGKTIQPYSGSYSSVSNSPSSAIQQIRHLIPNAELHNDKLNLYSNNDSHAQLSGEKYPNSGESLSSQENGDERIILTKERRLRKKQKKIESRLGNKNLKDFTIQSESHRKHIEENLEPGNSGLNSQLSIKTSAKNLNPRENKKLKNIVDPISQETNEFKTDTNKKRKRQKKSSQYLMEKLNESGGKTSGSKEQITHRQEINLKGIFGKHQLIKIQSEITAKSVYLGELFEWEKVIVEEAKGVANSNSFLPKEVSTSYISEILKGNNIKDKQLLDFIMEGNFMFSIIFFRQLIENIERIDDIFLKSTFLNFFSPIRQRFFRKKSMCFIYLLKRSQVFFTVMLI